jgi:uncharacterized membrane protein
MVIDVLRVFHMLAAAVWLGGTVALVFAGVPVVRTLTGEERARAMRMLGRRWRPWGWGSLGVAVVTGAVLASREAGESVFDAVLTAKVLVVGLLMVGAYLHDFVLGPALARQIREGEPETLRPRMVVVGWTNFALTVAAPVLGVVLTTLAE